jgi:hypothetical protein
MREIRFMKLQIHPPMARIYMERLEALHLIWVRMKIDQFESDQYV